MGNYDFELELDTINTQSTIIKWVTPSSRVLEFGPANGRLTRYLKEEKKCEVTIVEYDYSSGVEAKKYAKEAFIGPERGDAQKNYWRHTKKFDYIIFADVLEHLIDPYDVLCEAKRHLMPNGEILISVPNLAHNSIIIDLINDNFDYQETGLLDRTHVHFFTYKTIVEMIQKVGLCIKDEVPIYSAVGANEIQSSYNDVPYYIESFLRKRDVGSVYQYVFRLSKGDCIPKGFTKPFEQEKKRDFASQLFYTEKDVEIFDDEHLVTCIINEDDDNKLEAVFNKEINRIRFQPIFGNCILNLKKAIYYNSINEKNDLPLESMDAVLSMGNLYVFETEHPSFYYRLNGEYVKKIIIEYEIIEALPSFNKINKILDAIKIEGNK